MRCALLLSLVLCGARPARLDGAEEVVAALTGSGSGGAGAAACIRAAPAAALAAQRARTRAHGEPAAAFAAASARAGGPPVVALLACLLRSGEAPPPRAAAVVPRLWPAAVAFFGASPAAPFEALDALLATPGLPAAAPLLLLDALRGDWELLADATAAGLNPARAAPGWASALQGLAALLASGAAGAGEAAWLRAAGARLTDHAGAGARAVHASDVAALAAAMSARVCARVVSALGEAVAARLAVERDVYGRTAVHLEAALALAPGRPRAGPLTMLAHSAWLRALAARSAAAWCDDDAPPAPLAARDAWGMSALDVAAAARGAGGAAALRTLDAVERRRAAAAAAAQPAACWLAAARDAARLLPQTPIAACLANVSASHGVATTQEAVAALLLAITSGTDSSGAWPPPVVAARACLPAPTDATVLSPVDAAATPAPSSQPQSRPPARGDNGGWVEPLWLPLGARNSISALEVLDAGNRTLPCPARVIDVSAAAVRLTADGQAAADDSGDSAIIDAVVRALTAGEPLLLRGYVAHAWPELSRRWALPAFLSAHGAQAYPAGAIPYSGLFGHAEVTHPLAAFVLGALFCSPAASGLVLPPALQSLLPASASGRARARALCTAVGVPASPPPPALAATLLPQYIFTRAPQDDSLLADMPVPSFLANVSLRAWPLGGWLRAPPESPPPPGSEPLLSTEPEPLNRQLYAGVAGSGAPHHYHNDAANVLVFGAKRWFLHPPHEATYSTQPVSEYVRGLAAAPAAITAGAGGGGPPALAPLPHMCEQLAGDVLIVPRGWGHAVLNSETSVGFAVEFSTPLRRY